MLKIVIIIPYFGKLPFWMPFFLESCKSNSSINWAIITDHKYDLPVPINVNFIYQSYSTYCDLVSDKLKINFRPSNTYKLCDIKPALGYIHNDLIKDYDFWGFGDLDLIYGDLRSYFTEYRLSKKSLFSTMATRVSGHLCLIRNNTQLNCAFMRVRNWKLIFEDHKHHAFDEKAFSKLFIRHKNLPEALRSVIKFFRPWLRLAEFVEAYSTPNARIKWLDQTYNFPKKWFWKNGLISNDIDKHYNFPYFHFMVWKKKWVLKQNEFSFQNISQFTIDENGFHIT